MAVVGDFNLEEVGPSSRQGPGRLDDEREVRAGSSGSGQVDVTPNTRQQIETPDKENAVYLAGTVILMGDAAPDYPAILIANQVLEAVASRPAWGTASARRKACRTGSARSCGRASLDDRSTFLLYAITNPVNMPKVEAAMKSEVEKLVADGVTSSELSDAQKGYLENLKVTRTSDNELGQHAGGHAQHGPDDGVLHEAGEGDRRTQHGSRGRRPQEPPDLEADRWLRRATSAKAAKRGQGNPGAAGLAELEAAHHALPITVSGSAGRRRQRRAGRRLREVLRGSTSRSTRCPTRGRRRSPGCPRGSRACRSSRPARRR